MKRYSTIDAAVQLAIDILEVNHITCDTESIFNKVYSWYVHSDVTDPEILAGCALTGKNWWPGATYRDMLNAKEQWFPQNPYDNISIWEIESSLNDATWR